VVTYPGGTAGNATLYGASTLDTMTETASHEIAEAVTDPDVNYQTEGWYDDSWGEVGDITNLNRVYLNGWMVQRIANPQDQAMTPAGATAGQKASFVLSKDGTLQEHTSAGWTKSATTGIARISDQGIDDEGHAFIDCVTTAGVAFEYHDGGAETLLGLKVKDARAGQAVSYVLYTDGTLKEYFDATGIWRTIQQGTIQAIDAGTDRYGVSAVTILYANGNAWLKSDSDGSHFLAYSVKQLSAGQQGDVMLLTTSGDAYHYNEVTGTSHVASSVAQVTAGTDQSGNFMYDLLFTYGWASEVRNNTTTLLGGGMQSLSKPRAGVVDAVFSNGNAEEDTASGWALLTSGAVAVA
jgi:hypothetical protein